jgi:DNA-binding NarL/FixJ family response regulator
MGKIPTIVLTDDHELFRAGLKALIDQRGIGKVVAEAANGKAFLDIIKTVTPDLVLMDISMPEMDGIVATREAIEMKPSLNILALSMFGDEAYYQKMIEAGAKGFVLKSSGKNELEEAIATVAGGGSYFSNELLRSIILSHGNSKAVIPETNDKICFTRREYEVLRYICNGLSSGEIADKLSLSQKTVQGHRTKLQLKTGTNTSVALALYAFKNRIVAFSE